ncbi:MAG: endonuclease/exonuclease/phosphatase family protein [bacterium]|nr:endonuclease/exonuclease/phosphatase family protein [bacterium]
MRSIAVLGFTLFMAACAAHPTVNGTLLRVLSYNIKHGRGNDGKVNLERAAAVIRRTNADVVFLQEIDDGVLRSGQVDQMQELGQLTGLHSRFGAFMNYQGGAYGMGLLSRHPITASHNRALPDGLEPRTALDALVTLPNGKELLVCNVHLYATEDQRLAQARCLTGLYRDSNLPMVLAGDFNSDPDSVVMAEITQHWTNVAKGEDRFTFSATEPEQEIDYVLFRPAGRFEIVDVDVLDEPLASDHRPVLVTLKVR